MLPGVLVYVYIYIGLKPSKHNYDRYFFLSTHLTKTFQKLFNLQKGLSIVTYSLNFGWLTLVKSWYPFIQERRKEQPEAAVGVKVGDSLPLGISSGLSDSSNWRQLASTTNVWAMATVAWLFYQKKYMKQFGNCLTSANCLPIKMTYGINAKK